MSQTNDILFGRKGVLGVITLNRPKALNALTMPMCIALKKQLDAWAHDDEVKAVVIQGEGDRAFCAGGDVVALYEAGKAGTSGWQDFFAAEYRMNAAIGEFPKPYIAFIDGVVMGGGVGVSVHGPYRIATERTLFAMPETGIGLIPDVGGGYFMPRLPGEAGMFLALTGERLKAADCLELGVATHYVESTRLPDLLDALSKGGDIDETLAAFKGDADEAPLAKNHAEIDRIFALDSVEAILAALQSGSEWAQGVARHMEKLSPTSMKLTYRQMREGGQLSLREALTLEYRLVGHIKAGHDFYEGIRAQLIDKDRNPKWDPPTLQAVDDEQIAAHFTPPPWGDLDFNANDTIETKGDAA